jgi:hypothetical protein
MVEVSRLVHPDMMIEIEADALIGAPRTTAASAKPAASAKHRAATKSKRRARAAAAGSKPSRRRK